MVHVGAFLALLGAISVSSWAHLGIISGYISPSWAHLELSWVHHWQSGSSWVRVCPFWLRCGPSFGVLSVYVLVQPPSSDLPSLCFALAGIATRMHSLSLFRYFIFLIHSKQQGRRTRSFCIQTTNGPQPRFTNASVTVRQQAHFFPLVC